MTNYYELHNRHHSDKPGNVYGVARMDDKSGKIERWNDGEWCYAPDLADELIGGEPGARPIDESKAKAHIAGGHLIKLDKTAFPAHR